MGLGLMVFELSVGLSTTGAGPIGNLYSLVTTIPGLALAVRRMHDIGKSGWYNLIPIYNLYLSITPSEQSDNEWGSPRPHTIVNQSASDDE